METNSPDSACIFHMQIKGRGAMDKKNTAEPKIFHLWTEFKRNNPLRVPAFFFIIPFAIMTICNFV